MSRNPTGRTGLHLRRLVVGLTLLLLPSLLVGCGRKSESIAYSELKQRIAAGEVAKVRVSSDAIDAEPTAAARKAGAPELWTAVPVQDDASLVGLMDAKHVEYDGAPGGGRPSPWVALPFALLGIGVLGVLFLFQRKGATTGFGVARLRLKDAAAEPPRARFEDVAGIDEVKEELTEIVAFLREPERYRRLGVRVPKGVLLVGAPGTGKTLLAKAVAGEAGVPFFSMSGSDFVEIYVGVGAARVRKLFESARQKAPCIVFIDELDAIGKSRAGGPGANDEREQALNQLLVAMDGFESSAGVIVMAATNRPEILDSALLRPGRFDRQVAIGKPDTAGREAILGVHARRVRLSGDVALRDVAMRTAGFTGADLANVLNEAGLIAARRRAEEIGRDDVDDAIDRVIAGIEKKSQVLNPREREIVAWHEAGHAVVAACVENADPVRKISIIPRGIAALGYTQHVPEDRNLYQTEELTDRLAVLLGGRAAEHVALGAVSTGASNDLERASGMARRMVAEFGMTEALGPVAYAKPRSQHLGGEAEEACSEDTARRIDGEVQRIVTEAYRRALAVLEERRGALDRVAARLLEVEVMDGDELVGIVAEDRALV